MENNSFDSSQESQDSIDVQKIEDNIFDIINNDLNKDFVDKKKVIKRLLVAVTTSRKIFQHKIKMLNQIIQKLITYCIMSGKDNINNNGKGDSFDDIIIEFISIYSLEMRNLFINSLVHSILDLFSPEKANHSKNTLLLPNVEEKLISIECEASSYAIFYLTLLYKISIRFKYDNPSLINLFQLLLSNNDPNVQLITLSIMTEISSISINFSYQMIRLVLWYIRFYFQSIPQVPQEKVDSFLVQIFDRAINVIPPFMRHLVGREIFSYLSKLTVIIGWHLLDHILNLILEFIKSDHVNTQLCAPFFINLFKEYYANETFVMICRFIATENISFKNKIWSKYSNKGFLIPALLTICPGNEFDYGILENIEPYILYDIVINLKTIPENIEKNLINKLVEFPPQAKHVKNLINYIPEMPLANYSPDILTLILKEDENRIFVNYDQLKKIALESKYINLISFLAEKCPSDRNSYTSVISSFTNDINAWEDENFRHLIAQIFIAEKSQIKKQKGFFTQLLYNSKLKLMYYIGQEKPLWKLFLWLILHEFTQKSRYPAEAAISVLHQLDNFQEIFSKNSFYFFKHILVLIDDKNNHPRFKNIMMTLFPYGAQLKRFASEIVPILIRYNDLNGLKNYYELSFPEMFDPEPPNREEILNLGVQNLISNNISNIFFYLFVYCRKTDAQKKETKECLNFLKKLLNNNGVTKLLKHCIGGMAPKLLLYLGSDDPQLLEGATKAIDMVTKLCYPKESAKKNIMQFFWEENFLNTIIDFCKILYDRKSYIHKNVFKSLIYSVEFIEPFFHNCYPRILSIADIGMRSSHLRELCIEFWRKMVGSITNKPTFPKIFGPVLSQLLPYFDEYPDQITEVLKIIIIDNSEYTNSCLIEIAHIPLFQEKPQLVEINEWIHRTVANSDNWSEIVEKLASQLDTTAPPFRQLILQQLYLTLKSNMSNININDLPSNKIYNLFSKLWLVSLHEKVPECIFYCSKCMSFLPFDKEITSPEQNFVIDKNNKDIIIVVITDYLTKILEDSSIYTNHDHAAYAIQELLKVLGCSDKNYDELCEIKTWKEFPVEIQDIIYPFTRSRYAAKEKINDLQEVMKQKVPDVNTWLFSLSQSLLKINQSDKLQGLDACNSVLPNSPSLCKFLLPYLVFRNMESIEYKKMLRSQWKLLLKMLNGEENPRKEFAKQALLVFFSLFDTLALKSISPGNKPHIPYWKYLLIASDDQIADAALKCELYYRALQHIEFKIYDDRIERVERSNFNASNNNINITNNNDSVENEVVDQFEGKRDMLLEIFEHIDDPDGVEFLKRNSQLKQSNFNESLISLEIQSLTSRAEPTVKLQLIKELIAKGRYERALSDALDLKSQLPGNLEIEGLIAQASLRLQRWDKMSQLELPDSIDHISPNNRQNAIDIITARLIYFKKNGDTVNFNNDIRSFRSLFVPMFQSAEMISYFRMVPLFVQLRLIEEIVEFSIPPPPTEKNVNDYSKCSDFFNHWENMIPMKLEDMERIVAVRSALIGALVEKENPMSSIKITSQWLQLARYCRKSSSLHKSKVFCSRANSFAILPASQMYCSLEMAKIYFSLNHTNAATSLLRQIMPKTTDNKQLLSKIKYIDANWAEQLSSSDRRTIIDTYSQSLDICKTAKAHLALATITDNCVTSIVNNFEQNSKESFKSQSKEQQQNQQQQNNNNNNKLISKVQQPQPLPQPPQQRQFINTNKIVKNNSMFWTGLNQNKEVSNVLLEFLPLALSNYMQAMIMSPNCSYEIVPRILMLMFDVGHYMIPSRTLMSSPNDIFKIIPNSNKDKILKQMKEAIKNNMNKVKSSIWVNSITQLISRIEQPVDLIETLYGFILPALNDYPHATFWHLMSIKRTKDRQGHFSNLWQRFEKESTESNIRMKLINDLKEKYDAVTGQLIDLIKFGYTLEELKEKKINFIKCSETVPDLIKTIKNSEMVTPLSSTLTIDSNMTPETYIKEVPKIIEIEDTIRVIHSQQCPKKIKVKSTNGFDYHYLIKKDIDLRKDMRMMEFGSFINRVLKRDKRSRQRALSIITYAVICLDQMYGMIEWVENSATLGATVIGMWKHLNLLPNILKLEEGFKQDTDSRMGRNEKYKFFVNCLLPGSPPMMHIWFAKNFKKLSNWYQARLAFTRTVSLWSMIGFIVGLGDRHPDNLLINLNTGACFHVDFAVLFDKGKTLNQPEIVPFRMTRNIVYGMSVLGTNGGFFATSSLILKILRENKQKILSVLQTFIHDPLIEWKLYNMSDKNPNTNNLAVWHGKMMLKEVERRLSGIIEDKFSTRSPDCVVEELIKQATDNENLFSMYYGWKPFL